MKPIDVNYLLWAISAACVAVLAHWVWGTRVGFFVTAVIVFLVFRDGCKLNRE